MRFASSPLLIVAAFLSVPARADDAAGCGKFKWSIERERQAFAAPALPGVASGGALPGLTVAVSIKLQPQSAVTFAHPPGRKPKADPAYAAVVTAPAVVTPGSYEVTVSGEAWIDVLQDGKDIRSSGFSGQPDCAGVRKSVKFVLRPGPATIQISGASSESITMEILPAE